MLDIDNPKVDNLDIWYTYTKSVIMLDAAVNALRTGYPLPSE